MRITFQRMSFMEYLKANCHTLTHCSVEIFYNDIRFLGLDVLVKYYSHPYTTIVIVALHYSNNAIIYFALDCFEFEKLLPKVKSFYKIDWRKEGF